MYIGLSVAGKRVCRESLDRPLCALETAWAGDGIDEFDECPAIDDYEFLYDYTDALRRAQPRDIKAICREILRDRQEDKRHDLWPRQNAFQAA